VIKVLIIGGKNSVAISKQSKLLDIKIIHHPAHIKQKHTKRYFEALVKSADCVVLYADACSHKNMWDVRSLAKEYNKSILYPKGIGATNTLRMVTQELNTKKVG
jgi:hypothetical protein